MICKRFDFFPKQFNFTIPLSSFKGLFEIFKFRALSFFADFRSDFSPFIQEGHNLNKIFFKASSCGHGWTSYSDTWRDQGAFIPRNSVFVDVNINFIENGFDSGPVKFFASHIEEEQMIVSSPRHNLITVRKDFLTGSLDIFYDLYFIKKNLPVFDRQRNLLSWLISGPLRYQQ